MAVTYEMVKKDEGEWQIVFKLASITNMKMIVLADDEGKITDYNLLATNSIKPTSEEESERPLSLQRMGVADWNSSAFKKQNGASAKVLIRNKES